jgi:U3 small nucleolar RNA-associated protein 20
MLACLHNLRNADDLALRQAAAQALERMIQAAVTLDRSTTRQQQMEAAPSGPVLEDHEDSVLRLLGRMFYSQLKSQLGHVSLAVSTEFSDVQCLGFGHPFR